MEIHRRHLCHLGHCQANLEIFIADLNQAHPTIKFTAECSSSSIPFLDTHVQLENEQLTTDLHVKPMDTHQYLAANSCHPRHCKEAIPFSQALRMCRICSTNDDFRKRSSELKTHLLHCGYEPTFVQDQIDRSSISHQERRCSHPTDWNSLQQEGSTGRHVPPQLLQLYCPDKE